MIIIVSDNLALDIDSLVSVNLLPSYPIEYQATFICNGIFHEISISEPEKNKLFKIIEEYYSKELPE